MQSKSFKIFLRAHWVTRTAIPEITVIAIALCLPAIPIAAESLQTGRQDPIGQNTHTPEVSESRAEYRYDKRKKICVSEENLNNMEPLFGLYFNKSGSYRLRQIGSQDKIGAIINLSC